MLIEAIKNIFRKPSTKTKIDEPPNGFRGIIEIDKKRCIGCELCVRICPSEALELKNKKAEYFVEKCTFCGFCARICPVGAIKITKKYLVIKK